MNKILQSIEIDQTKKNIPKFRSGDHVEVKIWIMEGSKRRLQTFEGVIIAIKNRGIHSSFTVRKTSHNEGVERVFQTHSPIVNSIIIKKFVKKIKKSKLYYLRNIYKNLRARKKF